MAEQKKYLKNIPGQDTFIHTLKFDLSPPLAPLPYGKLLYYPLDNDRYIRPKITSLNFKQVGALLTKCDLGLPLDEINLKFDQYNLPNEQKSEIQISADDQMLIDEIDLEEQKILQQQKEENEKETELNLEIQKNTLVGISGMVYAQRNVAEPKSKPKVNRIQEHMLPQYIENTFTESEKIKIGMEHPQKPSITCKKIYDIQPQFEYLLEKLIIINDAPNEKAIPSSKDEIYLLQKEEDIDRQEILKLFCFGNNNNRKESLYQIKEKNEEQEFIEKEELYDPLKMDIEPSGNPDEAFDPDAEDEPQQQEITKIRIQKVKGQEENQIIPETQLKSVEKQQKYWFEHKNNFKISQNEIGDKYDFLLSFDSNQNLAFFKRLQGNLIIKKKMYGMNKPNDWNKRIKLVILQSPKEELEERMKQYKLLGYKRKILQLQEQIKNYKQEYFVDSEKEEEENLEEEDDISEEKLQQQADRDFIQDSLHNSEKDREEEDEDDYFAQFEAEKDEDEEYIKDDEQFFNLQNQTKPKLHQNQQQHKDSFAESSGSLFQEEDQEYKQQISETNSNNNNNN